jgi:ubiquinone/menaquinone biosynthesis C-methylase UbiE
MHVIDETRPIVFSRLALVYDWMNLLISCGLIRYCQSAVRRFYDAFGCDSFAA